MAINWGKEASGFADGLVRGATAVSELYYRKAHGDYYREQAERMRRTNPRRDPGVIKAGDKINTYGTTASGGAGAAVPTAAPAAASVVPVPGQGVVPMVANVNDPPRYQQGGEVLPSQPRPMSEQEAYADEFRTLFLEANRDEGETASEHALQRQPPPEQPPGVIPPAQTLSSPLGGRPQQAQTPMRITPQPPPNLAPRDRAVGPALADRPLPPPVARPVPDAGPPPAPGLQSTEGVIPEPFGASPDRTAQPPNAVQRGMQQVPKLVSDYWPAVQRAFNAVGRAAKDFEAAGPRLGETLGNALNAFRNRDPGETGGIPDMTPDRGPHVPGTPLTAGAPPAAAPGAPPPAAAPAGPPLGGWGDPQSPQPRGTRHDADPRVGPVSRGPASPAAVPARPGGTAPPPAAGPPAPGGAQRPPGAPPPAGAPSQLTPSPAGPATGPSTNPADTLGGAISGAERHAGRVYRTDDESGAVVPYSGPGEQAAGKRAVLAGNGSATPQAVKTIDRAMEAAAGEGFTEAMKSTMRMIVLYDFYSRTGQSQEADEMAFELVQYSANVAAMYGREALAAAQRGDIMAASELVRRAYNSLPTGKEARLEGDKVVIYDLFTGKPEQTVPLDGRLILTMAAAFVNKSASYGIIGQRAMRFAASQKGARDPLKDELTRSQIDVNRARVGALGRQGRGGGPPGDSELNQEINSRGLGAGNYAPPQMPYVRVEGGTPVDLGPPAGPDQSDAGAGGGGPAPAIQTAATTPETISGGEGQAVLTGGEGADTMSDARPEPLQEGQQLAQAPEPAPVPGPGPPAPLAPAINMPAGPTPAPTPVRPPGNTSITGQQPLNYDVEGARAAGWDDKTGKGAPLINRGDGNLVLIGPAHPKYDETVTAGALAGVSTVPHPKAKDDPKYRGREQAVYHNEPATPNVQYERANNTFRPAKPLLTPQEAQDLEWLKQTEAKLRAQGKGGPRDSANLAQRRLRESLRELERRQEARVKKETEGIANRLTWETQKKIEDEVSTIRDPKRADPTLKPFLTTYTAFKDSEVMNIVTNLVQNNFLSPRAALEVLGIMAHAGDKHNARFYQVLGSDVSNTGFVVLLPKIERDGKEISPGYNNLVLVNGPTLGLINYGAAVNYGKWQAEQKGTHSWEGIMKRWQDIWK